MRPQGENSLLKQLRSSDCLQVSPERGEVGQEDSFDSLDAGDDLNKDSLDDLQFPQHPLVVRLFLFSIQPYILL